jgi:hypothetical protein
MEIVLKYKCLNLWVSDKISEQHAEWKEMKWREYKFKDFLVERNGKTTESFPLYDVLL